MDYDFLYFRLFDFSMVPPPVSITRTYQQEMATGTPFLSTLFDFSSIPPLVSITIQQKKDATILRLPPPLVSTVGKIQPETTIGALFLSMKVQFLEHSRLFSALRGPISGKWRWGRPFISASSILEWYFLLSTRQQGMAMSTPSSSTLLQFLNGTTSFQYDKDISAGNGHGHARFSLEFFRSERSFVHSVHR